MDCTPGGSSAHGILQARVLEWVAISSSGDIHLKCHETLIISSVDLSMFLVLELKHTVEDGFLLYGNIHRKIKKQKSQKLGCISIKLHPVCLPLLPPLPCLGQQSQSLLLRLLSRVNMNQRHLG